MKPGPQQLKDWIERMGFKTHAKAAHYLGLTESYLSRLLSDGRTPSLGCAIRLQEMIGIPVAAWARQREHAKKLASRNARKRTIADESTHEPVY